LSEAGRQDDTVDDGRSSLRNAQPLPDKDLAAHDTEKNQFRVDSGLCVLNIDHGLSPPNICRLELWGLAQV
jgi:hypothetical protein